MIYDSRDDRRGPTVQARKTLRYWTTYVEAWLQSSLDTQCKSRVRRLLLLSVSSVGISKIGLQMLPSGVEQLQEAGLESAWWRVELCSEGEEGDRGNENG